MGRHVPDRRRRQDSPALARRLGRDHSSMHDDLTPLLRCSKCGSKKASLRISSNAGQRFGTKQGWIKPPKLSDISAKQPLDHTVDPDRNTGDDGYPEGY